MIWPPTAAQAALGGAVAALILIGGAFWGGHRTGHEKAAAACDAAIRAAEVAALQASAQAVKEQRARADALAVANETLQGIASDILAQNRVSCPLDDDTRSRVLRIRPAYPDPALTAP